MYNINQIIFYLTHKYLDSIINETSWEWSVKELYSWKFVVKYGARNTHTKQILPALINRFIDWVDSTMEW